MSQTYDGGEAVLEAIRNLGVDYIISSPGSEWAPVWEALVRQRTEELDGPAYIDCWHESLAVAMAAGYTRVTGRLQAVLLHTGVGLLQGSMAVDGAVGVEAPMLVLSGESNSYGEDPAFNPGWQWYRNLSVTGGPNKFALPIVKWSDRVASPHTLYQSVTRAGEMAQRVPKGPTYLTVPIEVMIHDWTPPAKLGKIPNPSKLQPDPQDIHDLADLLCASASPVIITESSGRDVETFQRLVQLADLLSIPVVEPGTPTYANFPKDHPLHLGHDVSPFLKQSDLFLLIGCRSPWYPPSDSPAEAKVVVIDENPLKGPMAYQSLQADAYLEGDVATTLRLLVDAVSSKLAANSNQVAKKQTHWEAEHRALFDGYRSTGLAAQDNKPIDPAWLCTALSEVMPEDAVYVEETITHRMAILKHVKWSLPQSYFHPAGGLGQGLGLALGVKLASPGRPVVALVGDGSFLYNPIIPALGAAKEYGLPILIVVFNNSAYSAMKQTHLDFYPGGVADTTGFFHGVHIPGPNYAQLVEPFGGHGERVEDPAMLKPALEKALAAVNAGQVAIVDVVLSD